MESGIGARGSWVLRTKGLKRVLWIAGWAGTVERWRDKGEGDGSGSTAPPGAAPNE